MLTKPALDDAGNSEKAALLREAHAHDDAVAKTRLLGAPHTSFVKIPPPGTTAPWQHKMDISDRSEMFEIHRIAARLGDLAMQMRKIQEALKKGATPPPAKTTTVVASAAAPEKLASAALPNKS